ncbi:hypothetical protein DYB32_004128 [Aphanomyces invadans]|uniref:Uncharacterized protein n=1 Tax=Aphanomyces invadans TaxID=157072 RepID=A0A418B1V9_9STRA|nr:hypothetical protein DYB32_004128 [Aphanomyces invadans]
MPSTNVPHSVPSISPSKLSSAEQEKQLQTLLTSNRFEDAASWIVGSAYLSEKYKLADVIRLVLDHRHFDLAGRLIREHKLADNQQLVTFFVMELVRSGRFHLAVRYAQELIPQFNAPNADPSTRPIWTPSTLIKAMIRVQQYKPALKYTLQFHLATEFPVKKFVQGMLHEKAWLDAFTVIMEHKLDAEFSLDKLIDNLLAERQWSAAIKCVKQAKLGAEYTGEVLVHHMIQSGDFLSSLHYLKAFDLTGNVELVRRMLHFMIRYGELYKALKYSIKFGLSKEPSFDSRRLIDLAIDRRQFHVALLYIKKLKLEATYQDDLRHIAHEKDHLLASFRALMAKKRQRQLSPAIQARLQLCLGDLYEPPVDEDAEIVLSVEEEVFPRKAPMMPVSLLDRLRHLNTNDQPSQYLAAKPTISRLAHWNLDSFDGSNLDLAPRSRLGDSFGGLSRSFADVDRAFAYPPVPPSPVAAPEPSFRQVPPPPPQPPLPPMQPPLPPVPQREHFVPPLPLQPPLPHQPPSFPPPPPSSSSPSPTTFYGYHPRSTSSSVASLAMLFHNQPPPPPPPPPSGPALLRQPAKPHRSFVPSLSLKPTPVGPKHHHH